jgi:hypothetical protein
MGTPLLIIGIGLFVVGAIVILANLGNMRRRRRILDTPTSPIAQASGHGPVEIKGRVSPSEQGVLLAPFSGRHAVWIRICVQEHRRRGKNSYWHTVLNETESRPFYVEDGSGQHARIIPDGSNVMLDRDHIASSGTFNDPPPHLQAFLQSRGLSPTSWLGFNKSLRYQEEVLCPGDSVFALGPSRREAGPPTPEGYRGAASTLLVLFAGPGDAGELILTNKSEDQIVSKLFWGFVFGVIATALGGALSLFGVALNVFGAR